MTRLADEARHGGAATQATELLDGFARLTAEWQRYPPTRMVVKSGMDSAGHALQLPKAGSVVIDSRFGQFWAESNTGIVSAGFRSDRADHEVRIPAATQIKNPKKSERVTGKLAARFPRVQQRAVARVAFPFEELHTASEPGRSDRVLREGRTGAPRNQWTSVTFLRERPPGAARGRRD